MAAQSTTVQVGDPSGRGTASGYKVSFPARMRSYSAAEIDAVVDVMKNSESQTQGEQLTRFEAEFKQYTGANHAFGVDNCTNALRLAAIFCRFQPGDEVIVPAYTFCATAIPFVAEGAKLVWADMDQESWAVDAADIERKITDRTKAIVVVHLLGMPADMQAVMEIADRHGLRVIEDCAQAPGASVDGRKVGSFGDFGCFSFHTAKNFTTLGEGGMFTVRSDEDAKAVGALRFNGCCDFEGKRERYWVPAMSNVALNLEGVWPNNFCLGEAQCAVGRLALARLDETNERLIEQANKVRSALAEVPEISVAKVPDGFRHVFHQCVIHFDGSAIGKNRDDLLDVLTREYKIKAIVQYYPLYRYPLFESRGFGEHDCPLLESWWDNSFSLPWWCGISDEILDYMVASLKSTIADLKG